MSVQYDVIQLRRDLNEVSARVSALARRLDILEARARPAAAAPVIPTTPEVSERHAVPVLEHPVQSEKKPVAEPPPPAPSAVERPAAHLSERGIAAAEPKVSPAIATPRQSRLAEAIDRRLEALRARQKEVGWEIMLGTYWLPRAAVLCIAIAVVFFLSLAIDRWGGQWLPHLRIAAGYGACAIMLLIAWRLERAYMGLARVLYGGGFAVMYFVTFATHYVPFARVFLSPAPTLVLLAVVVVSWAAAAQIRQSRVIAVLVTGLGHFTLLLSTLTLERSGSISLFGLIALSAGSAFFLLRNRWYYIASIGMMATYLNAFAILATGKGTSPVWDFTGSMTALAIFFAIYATAELFSPHELRRATIPGWFRNAFVSTNTAGLLALGTLLVRHYDFTRPHLDLFLFTFAGVLPGYGVAYARLRAGDSVYNTYIIKGVTLATVGLATRYGGNALTVSLAVEMMALLAAARMRGLVVSRVLAHAVGFVAVVHAVSVSLALVSPIPEQYWTLVLQVGIATTCLLAASQLYQRTDWCTRSPRSLLEQFIDNGVLWQLDIVSERPERHESLTKPLGGLLFPYLYALGGATIFWVNRHLLFADGYTFAAIAWIAVALTVAAWALNAKAFGLVALLLTIAAAHGEGFSELDVNALHPIAGAAGIVGMAILALTYELRRVPIRRGLDFHQHAVTPYIMYLAVAVLIRFAIGSQLTPFQAWNWTTLAALIAVGLIFALHAPALTLAAAFFLTWSASSCIQMLVFAGIGSQWRTAAWLLIAAFIVADRLFALARTRTRLAGPAGGLALTELAVVAWFFVNADIRASWTGAALAAVAFLMAAYGIAFRAPVALALAVLMSVAASIRHVFISWDLDTLNTGIVAGFLLTTAFWIAAERALTLYQQKLEPRIARLGAKLRLDLPRHWARLPVVLGTLMLLAMAYRIPIMLNANPAFITIGFFGVAALWFVLSIASREKEYRLAGLAVIVLSLARLFLIDMSEQDPLLRVAAFAVVGTGLFVISVGYYKWMKKLGGYEVRSVPADKPRPQTQ